MFLFGPFLGGAMCEKYTYSLKLWVIQFKNSTDVCHFSLRTHPSAPSWDGASKFVFSALARLTLNYVLTGDTKVFTERGSMLELLERTDM